MVQCLGRTTRFDVVHRSYAKRNKQKVVKRKCSSNQHLRMEMGCLLKGAAVPKTLLPVSAYKALCHESRKAASLHGKGLATQLLLS